MPRRASEMTILSVFAARLLQYAQRRGLDGAPLLALTGCSAEELQTPGRRIPATALFDLYTQVMRALDDPAVPLRVAELTSMEDLHVMGFAVLTARDGREGIHRAVRYGRLITDSGHWEAVEHERGIVIRYHRPFELSLGVRAANETAVADFITGVRQVNGPQVAPLRVSLRHRAPADTRAHEQFFRCPIEWGAPTNEFELSLDELERAIADANPAMGDFFVRHAEELLLAHADDDSLRARVRHEIAEELPNGDFTLPRVARRLGMSERSLRRHLTEENTRFSELVAEVRHERARALLASARLSLAEIAFLLGFSNVSAFSRAFKKWSGTTPGEYRAGRAVASRPDDDAG
ncbi:AraC family transcriptional regulator [Haliangium sp.]|uniref:AraC family transcriptional regulator n=1 Tax=Haliangium sp. TaxID=2663208 RepID=UPI003D0BABC4